MSSKKGWHHTEATKRKISEHSKAIQKKSAIYTHCAFCNRKIRTSPSHIRKTNFCNYKCHGQYRKLHPLPTQFQKEHKIWKGRFGEQSASWKGGRYKDTCGYTRILIWRNGKRKYEAEHRLVMEKHLGRQLKDCEIVHHKNGIRDDNRLKNLRVVLRKNHQGKIYCPYCKKELFLK